MNRPSLQLPRPLGARACLGLLFAALSAGCSGTVGPPPVASFETTRRLVSQADDWDRAIVRKDLPAIAANMSDDFRQIRRDGSVVDRKTFLADIVSPDLVIDPYVVEDLDVRLYGTVALLCGRTRMTGTYAGKPFRSHYRYVDTYVLRDGRWAVCGVQITSIAEP